MRLLRSLGPSLAAALAAAAFVFQDPVQEALNSIREGDLQAHLYFLSHDRLRGRAPGTPGGQLAALYIASQFARAGLEPVGETYFQPVRLVGATPSAERLRVSFEAPDVMLAAAYSDDVVVWGGRADTLAGVDAEVVFVGYGVRAPEYGWDDFKGRDVEGKVLLFLVNDPPAPPDRPELFGGRAMTYYGRWSYKLEEAARRGAAGALLIHTPESAGYGWGVVQSSWTGEQLSLAADSGPAPAVEGWLTRDFARQALRAAGLSLEELTVRAARRDFRPVETGLRLRASVPSRIRRFETANVVGRLAGSDEDLREQAVVYTSHYDHLGVGEPVEGDSIYNGAYDNASGVALLLELAEAFGHLSERPARTLVFVATTAEEAGLLGAEQYVRAPVVPLDRTVAAINIDGANLWGETDDIVAVGARRSTLGDVLRARAGDVGMRMVEDPAPEKGFFFRSDHFPFARSGVPALYIEHGLEFRGRPEGWGHEQLRRYENLRYHRPSDEYVSSFDLSGAVQQARLAFLVGYDVAQAADAPRWHIGGRVPTTGSGPSGGGRIRGR